MISYDKGPFRAGRLAIGGFVLVAVAAAAWWGWSSRATPEGTADGTAQAFPWSRAGTGGTSSTAGPALAPQIAASAVALESTLPDGRPAFLQPEEWAALQEALKDNPQRDQEMRRILGYLRFQKKFELWQTMRESPDAAQRQALAREMLDELPPRVASGEVNIGEAQMLQTALIEDFVTDPESRRQRIAAEAARLKVAPSPEQAEDMRRGEQQMQDYKTREAGIISQWQAMPAEQRDPKWLETQLEAARRAAFEGKR